MRKDLLLSEKKDEELIELTRRGETCAFDEIIDRYYKPIYRYVRRTTGSDQISEELTQEIFVKVYRAARLFDTKSKYKFKSWIFTIAVNHTRDYLRKYLREIKPTSLDSSWQEEKKTFASLLEGREKQPYKIMEQKELAQEVQNILLELPESLREIIILAYYEKLTYNEIAEVLNIPLGTVKSRLHKAVMLFGKRWREYEARKVK